MATDMVKNALHSLLNEKNYIESKRMKEIKSLCDKILGAIVLDQHTDIFDKFAGDLCALLEKEVVSRMPIRSALSRQHLWEAYHKVRSTKLPDVWKIFTGKLELENDVMLAQMINDKVFEDFIKLFTAIPEPLVPAKGKLTSLEENIIRYASGFVPRSLLKQFKKLKDEKYAAFVDCLLSMSENVEDSVDCSFYDYTKHWTDIISRGGLFETNELSFMLFKEIEVSIQMKLQFALLESAKGVSHDECFKQKLVDDVTSDEDVLFQWSLSSVYIASEASSIELLQKIVGLWLTIRGFSIANEWLEKYKWDNKKSSVRAKGLRKTLKFISAESNSVE